MPAMTDDSLTTVRREHKFVRMRKSRARQSDRRNGRAARPGTPGSPEAAPFTRPPIERTLLENGLTLLTVELNDHPLVATVMLYGVGSVDEPAGKSGLAHLMEHMMFRGTREHPAGAIDSVTGRLGGLNNAVTTHDTTSYYFVMPAAEWRTPLALEADRMVGCELSELAFEAERRIALEERGMLDDDPEALADEELDRIAFGAHPYGRPVVGEREDIERLSVEDLRAFYAAHYSPSNAVLVVCGDVLADEVRSAAEEYFGSLPGEPLAIREPMARGAECVRNHRTIEERHAVPQVVMAFPCPPAVDPTTPALDVVASLLASGRSSLLYRRLVEERDVAVDVAAYRVLTRHPGLFYIAATLLEGADPAVVDEEVSAALEELKSGGLSAAELAKGRRLVRTDVLRARETRLGIAGGLALWEALAGWDVGWAYEEAASGAGREAVVAAARAVFDEEKRSSVWLRPRGR